MNMTIQELLGKEEQRKSLLQTSDFKIEENEKGYKTVTYKTVLGDIFSATFYTKKSGIYAPVFIKIMDYICDNYILKKEKKLIFLPPTQYWTIYKKIEEGPTILRAVGILGKSFSVNGERYSFPHTDYYFHQDKNEQKDIIRGVYGIYFRGDLIYVGSSSTDVIERWTQHANNFSAHSPISAMYKIQDLEDIEFKMLWEDKDINDMLPIPQKVVSSGTIQFVEQLLIKTFKPRYNIEGVSAPFKYKGTSTTGIDLDYVDIAMKFLSDEDYKDIGTILYEFCEIYGEEALIAVSGKTYQDLVLG